MRGEYDFIVVGSGPGGGPLACRLAEAKEGYRVALLEAGTDPVRQGTPTFYNYSIPALYTHASEDQRKHSPTQRTSGNWPRRLAPCQETKNST